MATYALTVSTDDLGLGVISGARVRIEKRRVSIADTYPPINNLVMNELATNSSGIVVFLLEPDDLTTYHVAKIFDLAGVFIYEKSFTMPPSAANLHDASISTVIGGSLIQFKENGNDLGTPTTVRNVDIVGSGVDATFAGDTVTIDVGVPSDVAPLDENSHVPDQHLSFVQTGTGAVARTMQEKMRESVSVMDFGAIGDGVADDSANALLAVAAANDRKCALFVPPFANILISGSTTLNPKYGVFGGGRISRGITGWTNTNPMILIDTDDQFVDGIKLIVNSDTSATVGQIFFTPRSANIEVAGTPKNVRISNCLITGGRFGIWPYGADGIVIDGNFIHTLSEAGIYIGKNTVYPKTNEGVVVNATITNNRIYGVSNASIGGTTGDGIKVTSNCTDTIITGNHISDNRGDSIDCFVSGNRLSIIGNVLFGNSVKGVDIKADQTEYPVETWGLSKSIIVSKNHIYGNVQMGISVAATADSVPAISIVGNHVHDNTYWGIVFDGYAGIIADNLVYSNGTYVQSYAAGIRIEGKVGNKARDITVSGNICLNNGCATGWTNSGGIVLFGYVDNVVISGNVCSDVPYLPNSGVQDYGIYIPTTATGVKVVGNKCSGNAVIGIGMANGADVSGEAISINVGDLSATKLSFFGVMQAQASVVRMKLIGSTSIAISDTNFWVFQVGKKSSNGATNTYLASKSTAANAVTGFVSYEVASLPALVDKNESIFFRAEKFGSAASITGLSAQVDLVTW